MCNLSQAKGQRVRLAIHRGVDYGVGSNAIPKSEGLRALDRGYRIPPVEDPLLRVNNQAA